MVVGVEPGSNDPHWGALPQVTVQPTLLPFSGPLVTVAAMPAVVPTTMVGGGLKPSVKVTMIGGIEEF
jgi:hypothetical protein